MSAIERLELIDAIVKRPGLYFGRREGYLREILAFQFGRESVAGFNLDWSAKEPLFPIAFFEFILEEYPEPSDQPWWIRLAQKHPDEKTEWEAFQALWWRFQSESDPSTCSA